MCNNPALVLFFKGPCQRNRFHVYLTLLSCVHTLRLVWNLCNFNEAGSAFLRRVCLNPSLLLFEQNHRSAPMPVTRAGSDYLKLFSSLIWQQLAKTKRAETGEQSCRDLFVSLCGSVLLNHRKFARYWLRLFLQTAAFSVLIKDDNVAGARWKLKKEQLEQIRLLSS